MKNVNKKLDGFNYLLLLMFEKHLINGSYSAVSIDNHIKTVRPYLMFTTKQKMEIDTVNEECIFKYLEHLKSKKNNFVKFDNEKLNGKKKKIVLFQQFVSENFDRKMKQ
jgi:hypothetical protein